MNQDQKKASERVVLDRVVSLRTDKLRFPGFIYLIDLGGEIVWCEDPSPDSGIDNCDVIEYRKASGRDKQPDCEEIIMGDYEKYRVVIVPALEESTKNIKFEFDTPEEAASVEMAVANTLLFIQDDLKVMIDYSNAIYIEGLSGGEWEEICEGDL